MISTLSATVVKLVDTTDSKSVGFGCEGSSPSFGTITKKLPQTRDLKQQKIKVSVDKVPFLLTVQLTN